MIGGRYRLRRMLAAGGMGTVYEAEDAEHGERVAIKLLHSELARDEEVHRRFRREASILGALEHPAVVRVRDGGTDASGIVYTVMELLEGETLRARIQRGPSTPAELAPVVEDLCEGLDAAHHHGVVHGDLKPANVFLLEGARMDVTAKIVDFGLSKVHGLERLTRTGEVMGTPQYMAPELLTGESAVDRRADVYGLGVLVFEALAGRPPFTERNPGRLLFQVARGEAPALEDLRPDVPPAVAGVVRRAMSPQPGGRPEDAPSFGRLFARALREGAAQ